MALITLLVSFLLVDISSIGINLYNGESVENEFTFVDHRDGKQYSCKRIGNQVWMTQDFAYKTDSGCYAYKNRWKRAEKIGYMYDWETANKIAPQGWHLPSKEEYLELLEYVTEDEFHPRITLEKLKEYDAGIDFRWNTNYDIDEGRFVKGIYPFKGTSLWVSEYGLGFKQITTYYTYFSIKHYEKRIGFGFYDKNIALCVRYVKD